MERSPSRAALERTLADVERRLAERADDLAPRFERARLLDALGRNDAAQQAYFAVLELDARHLGALNNLGNLLHRTGFSQASHAAYEEAVRWHPDAVAARVNLAGALLEIDETDAALAHYECALALDPGCAEAHQGLSYVYARRGDDEAAARHRAIGFRDRAIETVPYRGETAPVRALLLVSAIGGNVATHQILDDRTFAITKLFCEAVGEDIDPSGHDVVFNAIGDAERCRAALERARAIARRAGGRVLNDPAAVLRTGRLENARRLGRLDGVAAPRATLLDRDALTSAESAGFRFPFLLRSPGHHTGSHFVRVADEIELRAACERLPGRELLALEFLDARGKDGKIRKYRVMIVDGELYPLHLAISTQWMVHYYNADMEGYPEHRAEEARFLHDMRAVLGARALGALRAIASTLGLDYAGVDFSLDAAGNVLLFEANATMAIPPPPHGEMWEYRRPAIERVLSAVRAMLTRS